MDGFSFNCIEGRQAITGETKLKSENQKLTIRTVQGSLLLLQRTDKMHGGWNQFLKSRLSSPIPVP